MIFCNLESKEKVVEVETTSFFSDYKLTIITNSILLCVIGYLLKDKAVPKSKSYLTLIEMMALKQLFFDFTYSYVTVYIL